MSISNRKIRNCAGISVKLLRVNFFKTDDGVMSVSGSDVSSSSGLTEVFFSPRNGIISFAISRFDFPPLQNSSRAAYCPENWVGGKVTSFNQDSIIGVATSVCGR